MRQFELTDTHATSEIIASLSTGGIVVLPTDTLYGFSAALSSEAGYRRVVAVKGSDASRHFVHLAASLEMVANYIDEWADEVRAGLAATWPAPLTAVLPSGSGVPDWVGATIAFRVPDLPELCQLIDALGEPIISTSVNRSGERPAASVEDVITRFGDEVDIVVTGRVNTRSKPSTIVTFVERKPRVLRLGAYAWPATGKPSNWRSL